uniref:Atrial natriuretic peptide-converting enzyme n=1 Tax=Aceria tosichella TaxID=561515 RepID=A0A6G1S8T4_9ACAR
MNSIVECEPHNSYNKPTRFYCTGCHHINRTINTTKMKTTTKFHHHHPSQHYIKLLHAQSVLLILMLFISQTLTQSQNCQSTESFFCQIKNYHTVQPFNNTLGHTTLDEAKSSLHKYGFFLNLPHCFPKVQLFLCSLYFPVCVTSPDMSTRFLLPCRNICEEAKECEPQLRSAMNSSWPPEWDCTKFEYYGGDHKLCVIDNQKESGGGGGGGGGDYLSHPSRSPTQLTSPGTDIPRLNDPQVDTQRTLIASPESQYIKPDNTTVCDEGFFDCRLTNPLRPVCIEVKYVCDGKKDCYHAERDPNEGADEAECKERCDEGQLFCDDKCINRHDICNGKVDCSSGVDEQDCIDNLTGIIQSILCIFVMVSAVYVLVRFFRVVNDLEHKEESYDTSRSNVVNPSPTPEMIVGPELIKNPNAINSKGPYEDLLTRQIFHPPLHSFPEPLYQEPSILTTRSDAYERIIPGGYSASSSVYAFESNFEQSKSLTTPPAPPPTPSLDLSSSPFMRSNFYENMED